MFCDPSQCMCSFQYFLLLVLFIFILHIPTDAGSEVLTFACKQLLIHKLPQVLILHLKRFTIGAYTVTKNKAHVSFPQVLDMAPYSSNLCLQV